MTNSSSASLSETRKTAKPRGRPRKVEAEVEEEEEVDEEIEEEEVDEEIEEEEEEVDEEEYVQDKDSEASFSGTIIDGSSFRHLIEYLHMSATSGTFDFTKDFITLQQESESKALFNDLKIKTYKLLDYTFVSKNDHIPATMNLVDLRNKTRSVGKKEQLDVYRLPDEPSNFYIQVRSQEKGAGDNPVTYHVPMRSDKVKIYDLQEYARGKRNPNCSIYQADFIKLCKSIVTNKCSFAEFTAFDKGILVKGLTSDGKLVLVKGYGKCGSSRPVLVNVNNGKAVGGGGSAGSSISTGEIAKFRIHISDVKCLTKISGFSGNVGTIRFYVEQDTPMKLTIPVSCFGKLDIYIRSTDVGCK